MPLLIALVYFVVAMAIGTYAVAQYLKSDEQAEAMAHMMHLLIVAAVWPIAVIPIAAAAAFFQQGPIKPRA